MTERALRGSRRVGAAVAIIAAVLLLLVLTPAAGATAPSTFEGHDGNLTTSDGVDWANVPGVRTGTDAFDSATDSQYGGGAKENDVAPPIDEGNVLTKDDLVRAYLTSEMVDGHLWVYASWIRVAKDFGDPSVSQEGSASYDLELNQSSTPSANGVTPLRTAGDLLLMFDHQATGDKDTLSFEVYRWSGTEWQLDTSPGLLVSGDVNREIVTDPLNGNEALAAHRFGEAMIDLTSTGVFEGQKCLTYGSATFRTRSSSQSLNSSLKDLLGPMAVVISPCASVEVLKVDDATPPAAIEGAVFSLHDDDNGAVGAVVDGVDPVTTGGEGQALFVDVEPGTYWVVEDSVPAGYVKASPQQVVITTDTRTVTLTFVDPRMPSSIHVVKTGPTAAHIGDTVTYTYTVTNPGDLPLANVKLSDPKLDAEPTLVLKAGGDQDALLEVGEVWTYTGTHKIVAGDPDPMPNTATVTGEDQFGRTVTDTDDHSVDILHPAISIVKTASPTEVNTDPATVTFTYVVTNTGDTPLYDVVVTDDRLGTIGTIGTLGVGESVTLTKTAEVSSSALTNVGTAVGHDVLGGEVRASDDATVAMVLGEVVEAPAAAAPLAVTGEWTGLYMAAAGALLLIGAALVFAAGTRRPHTER